ncbi:MAG: hypothetical protein RLO06_06170, partial [Parvibaculum sp.]
MDEATKNLAARIFRPSQPVKERELLYGRDRQVERTLESLDTPGRSVFMFGERGVGKTSLAQTSAYLFNSSDSDPILISCHPT